MVPSPPLSNVQFALYKPCSNDDDYDDGGKNNILFFMGAVAVRKERGCGVASVLLFRDIKISFGAFASTVSYVDLFSTPENTRHKDAPARFYLAPKGHLLVCSATVAILPEDVLLAARKPRRHNAFHHKKR